MQERLGKTELVIESDLVKDLLQKIVNKFADQLLKDNTFFEGTIPDGYDLAVCPSKGYIIVDVDNKKGKKGSKHIPKHLEVEMYNTYVYDTKNNGSHHWFKYTGDVPLQNKASKFGIDLRVSRRDINETTWVNGGYVKWHPRNDINPKEAEQFARETSSELNKWLQELFGYNKKKK